MTVRKGAREWKVKFTSDTLLHENRKAERFQGAIQNAIDIEWVDKVR